MNEIGFVFFPGTAFFPCVEGSESGKAGKRHPDKVDGICAIPWKFRRVWRDTAQKTGKEKR